MLAVEELDPAVLFRACVPAANVMFAYVLQEGLAVLFVGSVSLLQFIRIAREADRAKPTCRHVGAG